MGNKYTVADLLARYGMKQSAFSRFLNRHINDINASGSHVTKAGGLLYFDDAAVQFLDRLRGAFQMDLQAPDSAAVLQEEISRLKDVQLNLQQALLVSRDELAASRKETIEVMKERDAIRKQLSDLSIKYALLEAGEDTSKHLKEENQTLRDQLSGTLRDIQDSIKRPSEPSGKGWNRRGTIRKIKLVTFH